MVRKSEKNQNFHIVSIATAFAPELEVYMALVYNSIFIIA